MVDENVLEVECTEYFSYGQVRYVVWRNTVFTAQENNAKTCLMYYGG